MSIEEEESKNITMRPLEKVSFCIFCQPNVTAVPSRWDNEIIKKIQFKIYYGT